MITIKTSNLSLRISRSLEDGHWGPTRDIRQYEIRTIHGVFPVDIGGFQAALGVLLGDQKGMSQEQFEEFDIVVNDILDVWQIGPRVLIDLSVTPTRYALAHDGKTKFDGDSYLGITRYMAELGFERLASER